PSTPLSESALGLLIVHTENLFYFLFLAVYGIDAVWTIVRRLYLRENIFQAHRSHLYQYLGNEAGVNKLWVSFSYGFLQLLIGLGVLYVAHKDDTVQLTFAIVLLLLLSAVHLIGQSYIIKKYVHT